MIRVLSFEFSKPDGSNPQTAGIDWTNRKVGWFGQPGLSFDACDEFVDVADELATQDKTDKKVVGKETITDGPPVDVFYNDGVTPTMQCGLVAFEVAQFQALASGIRSYVLPSL